MLNHASVAAMNEAAADIEVATWYAIKNATNNATNNATRDSVNRAVAITFLPALRYAIDDAVTEALGEAS
jgi:hypothetical protein